MSERNEIRLTLVLMGIILFFGTIRFWNVDFFTHIFYPTFSPFSLLVVLFPAFMLWVIIAALQLKKIAITILHILFSLLPLTALTTFTIIFMISYGETFIMAFAHSLFRPSVLITFGASIVWFICFFVFFKKYLKYLK